MRPSRWMAFAVVCLFYVATLQAAEVRKLGSNDLEWGTGTTTSPAGKVVTKINASIIPIVSGDNTLSVNDAVTAWVDVRSYLTLALADDAAVAAGKSLLISSTVDITSDITIASPVVMLKGGYLNYSDNVRVTLSGDFNAGLYKVFKPLASWSRYGSNLVTGWTNNVTFPYETFTSSGANITSAINTTGYGVANSNEITGLTVGTKYRLNFTYTGTSGTPPTIYFSTIVTGGGGTISLQTSTESLDNVAEGFNEYVFKAESTSGYLVVWNDSGVASNFAISGLSVVEFLAQAGDASGLGEGIKFGKVREILPEWWGANGNNDNTVLSATTEAIRSAMIAAKWAGVTIPSIHAPSSEYGPNYVGSPPPVRFQPGIYRINDEIALPSDGYYSNIVGTKGGTHIVQTDNTKKIFYGHYVYRAVFNGLTFVGGTNQISLYNPGSDDNGSIEIIDCYTIRNDPTRWAIYVLVGNTFTHINKASNGYVPKFLYVRCDQALYENSWLNGYAADGNKPNNTASIRNHAFLRLQNILLVPEVPSTPTSTNVRWIDNYKNVSMGKCRFGGENSGIPIIWNYASASENASSYTNQSGIIIEDSWLLSRQTAAFSDAGVIVLKTAVPSIIRVVGGWFSVEGALINDQIPGGVTAWLAAAIAANQYTKVSIVIDQVPDRATAMVTNAAAWTALLPYMHYTHAQTTPGNLTQIPNLRIGNADYSLPGKLKVVQLPSYDNNAAAIAGGLVADELYRSGADPDVLRVVH